MTTMLDPSAPTIDSVESPEHLWSAFHLHHHENLPIVAAKFVRPLVGKLLATGKIDSFFFINYPLGGPHLRLRLRHRPEDEQELAQQVEQAATEFIEQWPSKDSIPTAELEEMSRRVLKGAPLEGDASVFADNTFRRAPFAPETERYGGPALYAKSMQVFAVSSAHVLEIQHENHHRSEGQRLPFVLRAMASQALGLANSEQEFLALLHCRIGNHPRQAVLKQADNTFDRSPQNLMDLLEDECGSQFDAAANHLEAPEFALGQASHLLARDLRESAREDRWRIKASQLHMTANRFKLDHANEAYVSQLLWRAGSALVDTDSFRDRLASHWSVREQTSRSSWQEVVNQAFSALPVPTSDSALPEPEPVSVVSESTVPQPQPC